MNRLTALGPFGTLWQDDLAQALAAAGNAEVRRRQTWELEANLHCTRIGICLMTTDMRHLLRKLFFALRTASLACFLAALPDINVATGTV